MIPAVLYARVSSKDQEREGYSIPAQQKLLREYAHKNGFNIVREFVDVETAKTTGRKQFGEMVLFLREMQSCRTVLVEKTDRLYRNFRDYVTLEELRIEIHLPKRANYQQRIEISSKAGTRHSSRDCPKLYRKPAGRGSKRHGGKGGTRNLPQSPTDRVSE